ncbi:PaaI family thioesterase [Deinococcus sp. SM5_A1]|uniref:PaaI family thioesterase n=1 Tax=Deinococcus sp. SM5_A1 TaxID=3379094 RepID=UPI00385A05AC
MPQPTIPQPTLQAPLPPQAVQAVKAALHNIPMNATVGVTITDVGVGWATGECPDTPAFQNHLGTIHAGAQFLLAEAVSGAAFGGAFAAHFASAVPLIERLDTHYVGRARGGLTARAEARAAELPAALEAYKTEGKARLVIDVSVRDDDNKEVMRAVAHWYLRSMATLRSK